MEIQNLQKERGKGVSAELWCIRCRTCGHMKDQCPLLIDYIQAGGPSPLCANSSESALWCDDCCVAGLHDIAQCPWLSMGKLKQQWCRFCQSVGNDEKNYHTYKLVTDRGSLCRVQSHPVSPRSPVSFGGSIARGRGGRGGAQEEGVGR